jgi:hypothetical protein
MEVVRIIKDEDGVETNDKTWHFIVNFDGSKRTFCQGLVFGYGEGNATYKTKEGKITCNNCIAMIKTIKAVKL